MIIHLLRQYFGTYTFGLFVLEDGTVFHTLERPWLNNQRNVSCIPSGVYETSFLPRSTSGKYRNVWHVKEVSGRSGILIHNGNLVAHTRGCLLLGVKRGVLAGQPAVLASRAAMRELQHRVGRDGFTLRIIGDQTNA